jgi:transcriptional regulator with XRE-family HTH domain
MPQGNISRIESGSHKPSSETLAKLDKVLGLKNLKLGDMLQDNTPPPVTKPKVLVDYTRSEVYITAQINFLKAASDTLREISEKLNSRNMIEVYYYLDTQGQDIAEKHGFYKQIKILKDIEAKNEDGEPSEPVPTDCYEKDPETGRWRVNRKLLKKKNLVRQSKILQTHNS